mmetsp:Transcript_22926/g.60424  ORF Transcript_22926/g.60424 Transcript_22926/m.60424 type:complete len:636 (-) Transcript_22926:28-1935(-)
MAMTFFGGQSDNYFDDHFEDRDGGGFTGRHNDGFDDAAAFGGGHFQQPYGGGPYIRRYADVTSRTTREIAALKGLFHNDIVPPATSSGVLWHFRIVAFLMGWLSVLILAAGFGGSFVPAGEGAELGFTGRLACSWEGSATQVASSLVALVMSFYCFLVQGWTYVRFQEVCARLEHIVPLPDPDELAAMGRLVPETAPLLVDPTFTDAGYIFPMPFCGCGLQPGGHYSQDGYGWRGAHSFVTSAQLMKKYYWTESLQGERLCSFGLFFMLAGALQVWDIMLNCAQPGLMHGLAHELEEDSRFLAVLHGGWLSAGVIISLGAVQVANCRFLIRNALGAATAEKEWLSHDLERQEDRPSWHTAIGVTNQVHLGHLNLTYAWMSLEAAAATCGALHLGELARRVAESSRAMVEQNTEYKFRLKDFAEWDLKKVGIVTRVLQAFLLTALNVEYLGVSYHRSCASSQVFTLLCIFLSVGTALWKVGTALRIVPLTDVSTPPGYTYPGLYILQNAPYMSNGCRRVGILIVMGFTVLVALATVSVAAIGGYAFLWRCNRSGFSLLESLHRGEWHCWSDGALIGPLEAEAWNSGDDRSWALFGGALLSVGWVWLAYWGWWAGSCWPAQAPEKRGGAPAANAMYW